jgi:aminomethyltransferase
VHPLESGLSWTVSFKDGQRDFVGRAALEAADPRRTIVGLKLLERGVMRSHMKVRTPDGEGEVTSGTMSPTMGVSIGLARVPAATAPGTRVEVEIRGKWTPAEVTKLPFVRHGQILA